VRGKRGAWGAIALSVLVVLLLASAYNGLVEGLSATRYADTPGMRAATITQLLYGGCAVVALLALATRRRWALWPLLGWAATASATAGLAPVVYGNTPVRTGVLSGGAAALLAGFLIWAWHKSSRRVVIA
jgi:hypothetical protein